MKILKHIIFPFLIFISAVSLNAQNVTLEWERIDTTTGTHSSHFNTLVSDHNNDVYASGWKSFSSTSDECIIMKYAENGNYQWYDSFGYPYVAWKNNMNEGKVIKISPNGNIILAANTRRFGDKFEIRSYSSTGNLNWDLINDNIQSANGAEGHIADITVLPDNSIGIFSNLNYSNGQGNTYSMFKVNSSGQPVWSGTYSPNSAHDYGTSIEHDTAGVIYITGSVFNFDNGSYDFTTLNINPNGSNDWIARFNYFSGLKDMAYDMVVDKNQNQFITGISEITTGQNDMSTIMQNVYGTRLWQDVYGGSAGMNDTAIAVVTDNLQNAYVIGTTLEDTLGSVKNTITVIKYDGSGNRMWIRKFLGDDNLGGIAKGITIHKWGNVYLTGDVQSSGTGSDVFVACIEPNGNIAWTYTYNGTSSQNDYASGIIVTDDFQIYVSGSASAGNIRKHLIFKLNHVSSVYNEIFDQFNMSIPFIYYENGLLSIHTLSETNAKMDLLVNDISGKLIYNSTEHLIVGEGKINKSLNLRSGVYFISLQGNDRIVTKKLVAVN